MNQGQIKRFEYESNNQKKKIDSNEKVFELQLRKWHHSWGRNIWALTIWPVSGNNGSRSRRGEVVIGYISAIQELSYAMKRGFRNLTRQTIPIGTVGNRNSNKVCQRWLDSNSQLSSSKAKHLSLPQPVPEF